MPLGNSLGPRKKYTYVTDSGVNLILKTDATLGDLSASGLNTLVVGSVSKPTSFKPRGVYVQSQAVEADPDNDVEATPALRKFIICNRTGTLYNSDSPQNVTIDEIEFTTTGRVGEKQSF